MRHAITSAHAAVVAGTYQIACTFTFAGSYMADFPPSIGYAAPVTNAASSLAK